MGREGVCVREELHRLGRLSEGFHVRTRTGSGRVSTFFRTNFIQGLVFNWSRDNLIRYVHIAYGHISHSDVFFLNSK